MSQDPGVRTLAEARRADANRIRLSPDAPPVPDPRTPGQSSRLNPGELEEIEEAARLGYFISPEEVLAMAETLRATARRIARRFNETAEARADAAAARERAESAERQLKAWGPSDDALATIQQLQVELGWSRDRAEKAERELAETRTRLKDAQVRVTELERSVQSRDRLLESATREQAEEALQIVKARETEIRLLRVTLGDWGRTRETIVNLVSHPDVLQALDAVPLHVRAAGRLAEVVRGVQKAVRTARPQPTGTPLT